MEHNFEVGDLVAVFGKTTILRGEVTHEILFGLVVNNSVPDSFDTANMVNIKWLEDYSVRYGYDPTSWITLSRVIKKV